MNMENKTIISITIGNSHAFTGVGRGLKQIVVMLGVSPY